MKPIPAGADITLHEYHIKDRHSMRIFYNFNVLWRTLLRVCRDCYTEVRAVRPIYSGILHRRVQFHGAQIRHRKRGNG